MEGLRQQVIDAGQGHVFDAWDSLSDSQKSNLVSQLKTINFEKLSKIFSQSAANGHVSGGLVEPVTDVITVSDRKAEDVDAWRQAGLKALARGQIAVLLLAGGQGTRLGSSQPKGCYDIGLPSHKSLFALQAERLLRLQLLAGDYAAEEKKPIRWYIMTSASTQQATIDFFSEHSFFGLDKDQVLFFCQGSLPALTEEGKLIMETPHQIAMAPDGNGGVYVALQEQGILEDMQSHGVEAVDCYCVDNALARLGDPVFLGCCKASRVEWGARVVAKRSAEERVGVFARRQGRVEVVEYSELDSVEACAVDAESGLLRYNWANICMHYFDLEWLSSVCSAISENAVYHVARKQIPSVHGKIPGIKLELFIFDTFRLASEVGLFEVKRNEEFAPVKNAPGAAADTPEAACKAVEALHRSWIEARGGVVEGEGGGIEISPLVSYGGEGLAWVRGRRFRGPADDSLQYQSTCF